MKQRGELREAIELWDALMRRQVGWDPGSWLGLDVSLPQLKALVLISAGEGVRMRELSGRLGGSFSNATVLVDRLVERGLVERRDDPGDRRVVLVRATEEGRGLIERLAGSRRVLTEPLLENLAPEELDTVVEALRVLLRAAR